MPEIAPHPLASHPQVEAALALLESWIEARMAYSGLPGLSIGIVYDQDLVWARGFGYSELARHSPATPQTIYRIASISKTFTSTAIMQLRDQGRLSLDDPVARHLPWFELRNAPAGPPLSLRHLLTHTAGLPREAAFPYWSDFVFPTREQLRRTLPRQQAVFAPETRFKYSNLGLALAGEVVEAVSGEAYARYIQRYILEPLQMHSTSVALPPEHRRRLAAGYGRRIPGQERGLRPFTEAKALAPAANFSSTVEDLARFIALQFRQAQEAEGAQILRGGTLREMHRVHWLFPDWQGGRGLGFVVYRRPRRTLVGHGGHVAGYRTQIAFCPAEKIGVAVLTNASDGDPLGCVDQAFDWVAPALLEAAAPERRAAVFDPAWERYLGLYRNEWADTRVLRQGGELVLIDPADPDPREAMYRLVPAGAHGFRIEGEEGGGPVGERVVFELDAAGKVERLKIGENYTYPCAE